MKIVRLELETNDLLATQQFYARQLLLPMVSYTYWSATFRVGWSELVFRQTDKPVQPYHFAFNIPLYALEQYQNSFQLPYIDTSPSHCKVAYFPNWKARAAYFFDNNGNLVEFIERQDAGFAEPADDIFQGISEIGLVTNDVPATTRQLTQRFGIGQFIKSQPLPDFNAIGDDYGLFILAKTGRNWRFTDVPAVAQQCKVVFQTDDTAIHSLRI
ncbi:hypothetical protein DYU11_21765 [Fibrisoma montanum]|uniref:VOC domain-containing protein n=1 Tax=Fibrisoma montanum TaxID=2305895 RepID=A0A418M4C6_9BACT|nr:hypothetical protein [Fibrisoma montanum]RIV20665.1 hypothetical protein DYU11_21765 [Fibrisoma montanum]